MLPKSVLRTISSCLFLTLNLLGQNTKQGTVSGTVVDKASNRPMEFVNVVLRNKADSAIVAGTETDTKGKFGFVDIPLGEYFIRFGFIGYAERVTSVHKIDARNLSWNLGTVSLAESSVNLDEVVVTGQKALFNNSVDRKVYNIGQDIMSKSGSTSELLQNIPSVEVDIDGNVSLRGSSGVLILINGKTSPLMAKSSATVLQQMPASSIERIEIITNPSAKYKPDGAAGIINIVLRRILEWAQTEAFLRMWATTVVPMEMSGSVTIRATSRSSETMPSGQIVAIASTQTRERKLTQLQH